MKCPKLAMTATVVSLLWAGIACAQTPESPKSTPSVEKQRIEKSESKQANGDKWPKPVVGCGVGLVLGSVAPGPGNVLGCFLGAIAGYFASAD